MRIDKTYTAEFEFEVDKLTERVHRLDGVLIMPCGPDFLMFAVDEMLDINGEKIDVTEHHCDELASGHQFGELKFPEEYQLCLVRRMDSAKMIEYDKRNKE